MQHVLIVDDSAEIRKLLLKAFEPYSLIQQYGQQQSENDTYGNKKHTENHQVFTGHPPPFVGKQFGILKKAGNVIPGQQRGFSEGYPGGP